MKKIIYFLCIMFLSGSIKAITPEVIYQENIYSNRIGDKLYSGQLGHMFMEGHIVYCLDPFKIVGKQYSVDNNYIDIYDSDTLEYFEMVAYYGYNKVDRNNIYYYMATQELIWEKMLGGDYIYWTTEKDGRGNLINIDVYKKEIIENINKFYLKPSFDDKYFSLPFYDEIKIYDSNNVFDTYTEFGYAGNNRVVKNNKGFIISILEEGYQEINYGKTIKTDNVTTFYTELGQQSLASFGINKKIEGGFSILGREYYTNLSVVFYDDITKNMISDIIFEMESAIELNGEWNNIDGIYYYNQQLKEGKYKINVLEEYEIVSNNEFEVNKKDLQQNTLLEIYLKKIEKKEIVIDKNDEIIIDKEQSDNHYDEDNIIVDNKSQVESNKDELVDKDSNIKNEIIDTDSNIKDDINIVYNDVITNKSELIELPNTYNYNLKKYILLLIVFLIGIILYEKEIRD